MSEICGTFTLYDCRLNSNYYQILGVAFTATSAEIKAAYKQLAIRYHPDKHGGSTQYEEQFKQVSLAYQVLSNLGRRAAYDYQLQVATRRSAEVRRQQQMRPHAQHIYGVPMPAAAPLRTRPPANAAERHYRTIPRQRVRFNRRDYLVLIGLVVLFILFLLSVKATMDHVSGVSNYKEGMQAYQRQSWSAAHSFLSEAIHFKPTHVASLQHRATIEQLIYHNYPAALADYRLALAQAPAPALSAWLWFRVGQCQARQQYPDSAVASFTTALVLDSTLTTARFARGELQLLELQQYQAAIEDLSVSLRQARHKPDKVTACLIYRGLAYYKLQNFSSARNDYKTALQLSPRNGQVHFLLGRLAQHEEDPAAACECFREALQLGYTYAGTAYKQLCQ